MRGGGGSDDLRGGKGDDRLLPGAGDDELDGGPGQDTVDYGNAPRGIRVTLADGTALADGTDFLTSVEGLIGSAYGDTVTGSPEADAVSGGAGDDRIRGGGGDDLLRGEEGKDVLIGEAGVDTCPSGPGDGRTDCERAWVPVLFARAAGLSLFVPAQRPLLIAYHESLFRSAAAMKPVGDRKTWMIQPSRGRNSPATSAVDIPLDAKTDVVAPVDGKVIGVVEYRLYCEATDTLVAIRPSKDRSVTVEVLHLVDVKVRKGDEVFAGGTILGKPHLFPGGRNQVDAYVPGSPPHVHVEVQSDGSTQIPDCDYPRERPA